MSRVGQVWQTVAGGLYLVVECVESESRLLVLRSSASPRYDGLLVWVSEESGFFTAGHKRIA